MRWAILGAFMAICASPADAATLRCKGFAFIGAEFTCESEEPAVRAASFCDVMARSGGPFLWSKNDTRQTKERADILNAIGTRLCGWGKAK